MIEFRTAIDQIHLLKVLPVMERALYKISPQLVLKKEPLQNKCLVWIEFPTISEHKAFLEEIAAQGVSVIDHSMV